MYGHNNECRAIDVIGQDRSGKVMALFLEDRALSCHMTMDLLCQEMRDACWDSSESLGSPRSTVTANKSLSLSVDGLRQ